MSDLLLTHGYFLEEDEKERQIMKPYPPLGLLYLSAFLTTRGFAPEVFDSTFASRATLHARLAAEPGGTVGIYTNLMTRRSVLEIVRVAKLHRWTVILGGPESANYVDEYLERGADVIVIGEGELTLAELVPALARGGPHRLHHVHGIAFRDDTGACVRTLERAKIRDLDTLPFPDREAIEHANYLDAWKTHHGASSINLITARGCPYRCNWCSHAVYGYSHRRRSPANVATEVEWIVGRYDPDQVWYADDVFTISHPWLEEYAAELDARGLHKPFETITRADRLQTENSASLLRKLGCYRIWIGSESGSQRILDAMQRGVRVEQVQRAIKLAQAHGIEVGMFLMWGYDGEEIEDIAATVEHVKISNPDVFFTTVAYPIKGTGYFEKVRHKVDLAVEWTQASDRDYVVAGRRSKDYYKLADQWLRSEVEASRIAARDPCARRRAARHGAPRARGARRLDRRLSGAAPRALPPFTQLAAALRATTERLAREVAEPRAAAPAWSELEWSVAQSVAVMHGVAALLANTLRWTGPPRWQSFLAQQREQSLPRDARIANLLVDLDAATRAAGVGCVALKGAALRALHLHRAGERPMGDVDLLVESDDVAPLAPVLTELGYRESFTTLRHRIYDVAEPKKPHRLGEHADNPLKIEVHTAVRELLPIRKIDITELLKPPLPSPGLNAYASPAALLLHLLLHTAGSVRERTLRLIQLRDIALLSRRLDATDWNELRALAPRAEALWWAYPPLALVARYDAGAVPRELLASARSVCPWQLRLAAERATLTDVSWSSLAIPAFPGITWCRSPLEAARYVSRRVVPNATMLVDRAKLLASEPQLGELPWHGASQRSRIARWLFDRPPRAQTMLALLAVLRAPADG